MVKSDVAICNAWKSCHRLIVINNRNILVVASIDILSELLRFSFVLYSETRKAKGEKLMLSYKPEKRITRRRNRGHLNHLFTV
jgi:hypothetical protein